MMSLTNLKNANQAGSYYERDDYYSKDRSPSQWWGKAAGVLGLSGSVDREVFKDLLEGKLTDGTEMPDGHGGERRPGSDLTFSAPKSVSLMALLAEDQRILKAHRESVTVALNWLEETSSQARVTEKGKTITEATGNLLVARFDHDTTRELDPQLHTHAVVLNATQRKDGQWRAVSNEKFYDNKMAAGAIYRTELSDRLKSLGYEIAVTKSDGTFEIKGFNREQLEQFSKRREQIVQVLEEKGLHSAAAASVACLETRKVKRDVDRAALQEEWKSRARQMDMKLEIPQKLDRRKLEAGERRIEASGTLARLSVEHFSERKSVFSAEELTRFSMERGTGKTTLGNMETAFTSMKSSGDLIELGEGRYTTKKALKLEKQIVSFARTHRDSFEPILQEGAASHAFDNLGLTEDQKTSVELIVENRDGVVGIQGYAGTGKTTMLKTVRDIAEVSGIQVLGFSNTASAASVLQEETGIKSDTLSMKLSQEPLAEGNKVFKPQLWVVDEASMMGTNQCARLFQLAAQEKARLVLVGDRRQLPSIEAGKPFAILMDRGMQVATMRTIMRQKDPELKHAVEQTIAGEDRKALAVLQRHVHQLENREERLKAVADDCLSKEGNPGDRPLVITGTNRDRRDLNDLIRSRMEARGELLEISAKGDVLVPKQLSKAELKDAQSYQVGDVVRFGRSYGSLGAKKGEYAAVEKVDLELNKITARTKDGRTIDWEPYRNAKVELYEREERELRAGDLIRWTRNDRESGRRNGELAQVVEVDESGKKATLEGDLGKKERNRQVLDLSRDFHWEHGYASTIFSAQGRTTNDVLIHLDTHQKQVLGHEAWYVAISRARHSATIYTDDSSKLPEAIRREMAQESALEALEHHESVLGKVGGDIEKVPGLGDQSKMPLESELAGKDQKIDRSGAGDRGFWFEH